MPLETLVQKVQTSAANSRDYVVNVRNMSFCYNSTKGKTEYQAGVPDHGMIGGELTPHALSQLAQDLKIPAQFVRTLLIEDPHYLPSVMSHRALHSKSTKMLRTEQGRLMAAVSPSFSRDYDNHIFLQAVIPALSESGMKIASANLSDTHMHLKFSNPNMRGFVTAGDEIQAGIHAKNSPVGLSRALIAEMIEVLICTNGMTRKKSVAAYGRIHRGQKQKLGALDPICVTDAHIMKIIQDINSATKAIASEETFQATLGALTAAHNVKITVPDRNLLVFIENIGRIVGFTKEDALPIHEHLLDRGEMTQYGLMNAVTRYSQDISDYDYATELENVGGKVIELTPYQWGQAERMAA